MDTKGRDSLKPHKMFSESSFLLKKSQKNFQEKFEKAKENKGSRTSENLFRKKKKGIELNEEVLKQRSTTPKEAKKFKFKAQKSRIREESEVYDYLNTVGHQVSSLKHDLTSKLSKFPSMWKRQKTLKRAFEHLEKMIEECTEPIGSGVKAQIQSYEPASTTSGRTKKKLYKDLELSNPSIRDYSRPRGAKKGAGSSSSTSSKYIYGSGGHQGKKTKWDR